MTRAIALALLLGMAPLGIAQTPKEFVQSCRHGLMEEPPKSMTAQDITNLMQGAHCTGYVAGVIDAVSAEPPFVIRNEVALCVPAGVLPIRVMRRIVANATDNPEVVDEAPNRRLLVFVALAQLYPCSNG